METRRYINVRTWSEAWFEDLSATDKLVWIYLNTNSSTNMLGAYSTSIRRLSYECHISEPAVRRSIKKLEVCKKIIYQDGFVIIVDWMAQQSMNPSMRIAARKEYDKLPEHIRMLLSDHTHQAIQKTRQLSEQDASSFPTPNECTQGEKEEEKEMNEEELETGTLKQKREAGNPEEDSTPIPTREAYLFAVRNEEWLESLRHNHTLDEQELEEWLELFCRKLQNEGENRKSVRDFRRHFASWLNIQLKSPNNSKDHCHDNHYAHIPHRPTDLASKLTLTDLNPLLQSEASQRIEQLRAAGTLPTIPDSE